MSEEQQLARMALRLLVTLCYIRYITYLLLPIKMSLTFLSWWSKSVEVNMSGASMLGKLGRKVAQSYRLFVGNISWTVSQGTLLPVAIIYNTSVRY